MNVLGDLVLKRAGEWYDKVKRCVNILERTDSDAVKAVQEEKLQALLCCSLCYGSIDDLADEPYYSVSGEGHMTFIHRGIKFHVAQLAEVGDARTLYDVTLVLVDRLSSDSSVEQPVWMYDFIPGAWKYGTGIHHLDKVDSIFIDNCDLYINKVGLATLLKEQRIAIDNGIKL